MRDGAAEPHTLVDHGTQIGSVTEVWYALHEGSEKSSKIVGLGEPTHRSFSERKDQRVFVS